MIPHGKQGGLTTYGAMAQLKSQARFWRALAACIPETMQRQLDLEDNAEPRQSWLSRSDAAWRILGESAALQIFALEAYRHPRPGFSHSWSQLWQSPITKQQMISISHDLLHGFHESGTHVQNFSARQLIFNLICSQPVISKLLMLCL